MIAAWSSARPISTGKLRHCCLYTPSLSTWWSTRGLTARSSRKPSLEGGFVLRCFQRLSRPDVATLHVPLA